MWRGLFVGLMSGLMAGLLLTIKDRRWRFGIGTLLALLTLTAIFFGVISSDVRWPRN